MTRPLAQAQTLCAHIEAAQGIAIAFPVLAIEAVPAVFTGTAELAIFISANAVQYGLPLVQAATGAARIKYAAVGAKTAQALCDAGFPPDIVPATQFDSEGLLALPALQHVSGQRVVIFRGGGGRETLADTLRQRGAEVRYVEVYRRIRPTFDPAQHPWIAEAAIDAVIVTSGEGLDNLFAMLDDAQWLRDKAFVVISPRLAELAAAKGITQVCCATQADDAGLLAALQQCGSLRLAALKPQ